MFRKKQSENMTYGIVGLGRFGYALVEELAASGAELVVLDRDEDKIREIRDLTENAYVVKSLDKKRCWNLASRIVMWRWCVSESKWINPFLPP